MKFRKNIIYLLPIAGALIFSACNNEMSTKDSSSVEVDDYTPAIENKRAGVYPYELTLDPTFIMEMETFTYRLPTPIVTPKNDQGKNPEARKVKNSPETYAADEVDQAPVFGEACMTLTNSLDCTNDAIQEYFFETISYPDAAKEDQQEGYYKVSFTLTEEGKIGDDFRIVARDLPCEGCAEAAVNAIAQMPDWKPAMKDGKPVAVEVTIPVRFNYRMK